MENNSLNDNLFNVMSFSSKSEYIDFVLGLVNKYLPCSNEVAFFVACQSALETGYGTSSLFQCNLNLFGMRKVNRRVSTSYFFHSGHQLYDSCDESFIDYMLWLQMAGFVGADLFSLDKFCDKMRKSNYNPSIKYVDTILTIYKTYYHE